jgi:hypothetical protein
MLASSSRCVSRQDALVRGFWVAAVWGGIWGTLEKAKASGSSVRCVREIVRPSVYQLGSDRFVGLFTSYLWSVVLGALSCPRCDQVHVP